MDPLLLQAAFIALGILLQYLTPHPGLPDFPTPIYMLPSAPSTFFYQLSPTMETPTSSVLTRALFTPQLSLPLHPYSTSGSPTIPIELVHGSHLPWIQYLTPALACTISIVSGLVMVSARHAVATKHFEAGTKAAIINDKNSTKIRSLGNLSLTKAQWQQIRVFALGVSCGRGVKPALDESVSLVAKYSQENMTGAVSATEGRRMGNLTFVGDDDLKKWETDDEDSATFVHDIDADHERRRYFDSKKAGKASTEAHVESTGYLRGGLEEREKGSRASSTVTPQTKNWTKCAKPSRIPIASYRLSLKPLDKSLSFSRLLSDSLIGLNYHTLPRSQGGPGSSSPILYERNAAKRQAGMTTPVSEGPGLITRQDKKEDSSSKQEIGPSKKAIEMSSVILGDVSPAKSFLYPSSEYGKWKLEGAVQLRAEDSARQTTLEEEDIWHIEANALRNGLAVAKKEQQQFMKAVYREKYSTFSKQSGTCKSISKSRSGLPRLGQNPYHENDLGYNASSRNTIQSVDNDLYKVSPPWSTLSDCESDFSTSTLLHPCKRRHGVRSSTDLK